MAKKSTNISRTCQDQESTTVFDSITTVVYLITLFLSFQEKEHFLQLTVCSCNNAAAFLKEEETETSAMNEMTNSLVEPVPVKSQLFSATSATWQTMS